MGTQKKKILRRKTKHCIERSAQRQVHTTTCKYELHTSLLRENNSGNEFGARSTKREKKTAKTFLFTGTVVKRAVEKKSMSTVGRSEANNHEKSCESERGTYHSKIH